VCIDIKLIIGDDEGFMRFCIPYETIKAIISKIDIKSWLFTEVEPNSPEKVERIESKVELSKVDVDVILGDTTLSIQDITELQVGDVITLDNHIKSELPVYVEGIKRFKCVPGVKEKKMAVKITEIVRKEDE
jgi:flagellar motor switch protein FliM